VAVYALGRIALWSRDGKVASLKDLSRPGLRHIAIANPAHAPYGIAARQALEKLTEWKLIEPRLVLAENIRQTLQYAESGNAEVAITAWSLVFDRGGVLLPAELHQPIRQGCGIVTSSTKTPLARSFLDLLTSSDGVAILERFGLFHPTR
jgi:molybdate transport system substrate-binding protein